MVLVVGVLVAVMAVMVLAVFLVLRRVGDRAEGRADALRAEVAGGGERWVIPLRGAVYQGGAPQGARSKGRGVLGLTDRRLLFLPIAGERVGVPRARIVSCRVEVRHRDAATAHRQRLVVVLDDATEVTFLVDDAEEWRTALGEGAATAG